MTRPAHKVYPVFVVKEMKQVKLSVRLKAIIDMIEIGASVADIGTDHGFLPVYLAQKNIARRIIASDISAASLEKARMAASKYNVSESITFIAAPGLCGIASSDVDTIVIAGMGGETIVSILKDAPWTIHRDVRILLQPQTKIELLCRFLYDQGYIIRETKSVLDRNKYYTIIHAT